MKAKIKGITFSAGKVNVQVDYFFSEGEEGYDECYREIKQMVDDVEVGTGEWRLYPFNSIGIPISPETTKKSFKSLVVAKLRDFKQAHTGSLALQSWMGFEIEE